MASIEFIKKRIAGKEAEIDKLQKKLARIQKAKDTNWENNPYYYHESDLRYTTRDLEDAQKALDKWKDELSKETEKANSRNIQVIIDFLNAWKEQSIEYYHQVLPRYIKDAEERVACQSKHADDWNYGKIRQMSREDREAYEAEYQKAEHAYSSKWNWFIPYVDTTHTCLNPDASILEKHIYKTDYFIDDKKLDKELTMEANRKYDFIIERTNEIVGQITDASYLYIGPSGELNGYIVGTRGKAEVETIGAGGYNIQRFHFRTLIKPYRR